MHHRKMLEKQLETAGVRLGDSCSIFPSQGKKKAFTLNRHCIDLISRRFRPDGLSMSYVELPHYLPEDFHYRLELDEKSSKHGRFVLKTLTGRPFWINGLAAREAYVERSDRLYIEEHKVNFDPCNLGELSKCHFDHTMLRMQHLMHSSLNILITGETGTGKTHLAKQVHERSGRLGPFVAVNLSSFNPMLIESELFGHKKGSFSGALNDKQGALAEAHLGTLFLDEIDSLPLDIQTKLLTFMDGKNFRRVGDIKESKTDCRLLFASGRPLEGLVEQGFFRKDLYFRLKSGHSVELPSLRNEVSRIRETCQYYGLKQGVTLSVRLVEFYQTLAWPGNLRQLLGHLEKKRVLSKSYKLDFDQFDEELLLQSSDLMSLTRSSELISMEDCKLEHVKKAVNACEGNVSLAAKKLRLSEKTVRTLLQKVSSQGCR